MSAHRERKTSTPLSNRLAEPLSKTNNKQRSIWEIELLCFLFFFKLQYCFFFLLQLHPFKWLKSSPICLDISFLWGSAPLYSTLFNIKGFHVWNTTGSSVAANSNPLGWTYITCSNNQQCKVFEDYLQSC